MSLLLSLSLLFASGCACDDTDLDGACDDADICEGDDFADSDDDGVCDAVDLCDGDDGPQVQGHSIPIPPQVILI